jgi:alkyl hydroperoxide reductase subunit AhpC
MKYPVVRDGTNRLFAAYGLMGLPETFFIDREGRVRAHWIGEIFGRQLEQGVRLLER